MVIELIQANELFIHEEIIPSRVAELKAELEKMNVLIQPIIIDKKSRVILDGHHRYEALKILACSLIPVFAVDYYSDGIIVISWKDGSPISKESVIKAATSRKPFPSKTTRHLIKVNNELKHVSEAAPEVRISLSKLRQ